MDKEKMTQYTIRATRINRDLWFVAAVLSASDRNVPLTAIASAISFAAHTSREFYLQRKNARARTSLHGPGAKK